jgi:hypothetical protein
VVTHDVEEFLSSSRRVEPESVDEGGAGHAVLERRDGIVVRRAGKLGVALGETLDVVTQAFPRVLVAVAQLPLLAGTGVRPLEVADEDSMQIRPIVDLAMGQVLEPCPHRVVEVERQVLDDEEVIRRTTCMAREPVVLQLHTRVCVPVVPGDVGRSSET